MAEQRAEGLALVDEAGVLTDVAMPAEGTDAHATLLVAEHLAFGHSRRPTDAAGATQPSGFTREHDVVAFLRDAKNRYGRYWRKSAREPGAERELAEIAIERLEKLQLIVREADVIQPMPALARFGLGEADSPQTPKRAARRGQRSLRITMNDRPVSFLAQAEKPALPIPTRPRWQPLRLGLVELFHYDSEEFWFRDGHLLLRGNNGTGKSKVLSLTLPFLLDAQLKSSRIEPDGDSGKKMSWNLLMGSYDRRIGYAWIEFGRLADDGTPHYLTLGAGLSAVAARPQVESWFFVLEDADDAPRINQGLWLMSDQRVVLTKERLRDALEGRGQVFDTATSYRRAVDERLFRLGAKRYDALMDTLIQLRQPQLSKRPDETALSNALTEALPPLPTELLADVAEALGQLEEDRRQLEEYQALAEAVDRFDQRYRIYAGTQSRRQSRSLRQAQTEFDNASRSRGEAQARLEQAQIGESLAQKAHDEADLGLKRAQARLETLRADPTMEDANRLEGAAKDAVTRQHALHAATDSGR